MTNAPQHVAIIMDGNGRWAEQRGFNRTKGHETGGERVEEIIRIASRYGVRYLTLYAFSKENWQRPQHEVSFLMDLLLRYLDGQLRKFMETNTRFNAIGHLTDLPKKIQDRITYWIGETAKNTGLVVTFAFSYSSRFEITEACKAIAEKARAGTIDPAAITEKTISEHLYTSALPDPDLLIRTSGEMRISNFLLWQISYAELYVTEKLWPEFTEEEFAKAITEYQKRDRRFGKTSFAKAL